MLMTRPPASCVTRGTRESRHTLRALAAGVVLVVRTTTSATRCRRGQPGLVVTLTQLTGGRSREYGRGTCHMSRTCLSET